MNKWLADGSVISADMFDGAALAEILEDDGSGSGLDAGASIGALYGLNINADHTSTSADSAYGLYIDTDSTATGSTYGMNTASTGAGITYGIYSTAIGSSGNSSDIYGINTYTRRIRHIPAPEICENWFSFGGL